MECNKQGFRNVFNAVLIKNKKSNILMYRPAYDRLCGAQNTNNIINCV